VITKEDLKNAQWMMFTHLKYRDGSAAWYRCEEFPTMQVKERLYTDGRPSRRSYVIGGEEFDTPAEAIAALNNEQEVA
jgi:hypothetical protein